MKQVSLGAAGIGWTSLPVFLVAALQAEGDATAYWIGLGVAAMVGVGGLVWYLMLAHNRGARLTQRVTAPSASVVAVGGRDVHQTVTHGASDVLWPGSHPLVNVTPAYLAGLFADHVAMQADKLAAAYVGKWMRLSGSVDDVSGGEEFLVLTLREYLSMPIVLCGFQGTWAGRLALLKKGEPTTLEGKIQEIRSTSMKLAECALLGDQSSEQGV